MIRYSILDTPLGPLVLSARDGALEGVHFLGKPHAPALDRWRRDDAALEPARRQLGEYFAGERVAFDLPLAPGGTPFQRRVWQALGAIPCGETRSYGDLAAEVGGSPRAVGAANAKNPLSIVVPCHRVIGAAGALTGYAGGIDNKAWLLAFEGRISGARLPRRRAPL